MSSVFEALKNIDDFFKVTTTVSPLIGPRAKHRHEQNKCASESYTFSNPKVYNKNVSCKKDFLKLLVYKHFDIETEIFVR